MGTLTSVIRLLGLDSQKWARISPGSVWSATALAVGASVILALNRFGGIVVDAPRSFVRLALVGVWGWLGLSALLALAGAFVGRRPTRELPGRFQHTLVLAGVAHLSVVVLGLVVFVAAGLFQILGPGFVFAVFVLGFWFPASLVMATREAADLDLRRAVLATSIPYIAWVLVVGRHFLDQIQHLL